MVGLVDALLRELVPNRSLWGRQCAEAGLCRLNKLFDCRIAVIPVDLSI